MWDLANALDNKVKLECLCIKNLVEHTGRVFRLQFDEFQIVSSSHDDTILIWDFLSQEPPSASTNSLIRSPSHSYNNNSYNNYISN